jgi:hypothetical protein
MKKMSRLFILCFLTLSALLPSGADAALCFEENAEVDIHFLECETEHQSASHSDHIQEMSQDHNECNDLQLLCSIETSLSSSDFLKVVTQKSPAVYTFFSIAHVVPVLAEISDPVSVLFTDEGLRTHPNLVHISSIQILV